MKRLINKGGQMIVAAEDGDPNAAWWVKLANASIVSVVAIVVLVVVGWRLV